MHNILIKSWLFLLKQPLLKSLLLGLPLTMALASCSSMVNVPAPDTMPIQTKHAIATKNQKTDADIFTQCAPSSSDKTMCTMQYDPVCVKVKTLTGFSTQTAGNACSPCNVTGAISYTKGECS